MTTKNDKFELTPPQAALVDALAAGSNVADAATAIGVARQTASKWLHHDPAVRAALNQRRQELWAEATDKLRRLVPTALSVLEKALDADNVQAAVAVVKLSGLQDLPRGIGPTDPAAIAAAAADPEAFPLLRWNVGS